MKRFEYSPLGQEFKVKTDTSKKEYKKLDDTYEFDKIGRIVWSYLGGF